MRLGRAGASGSLRGAWGGRFSPCARGGVSDERRRLTRPLERLGRGGFRRLPEREQLCFCKAVQVVL